MEQGAPLGAERQAGRAAASEPAGRPSRRFSPVNFRDVTITGAFWRERLDTVLTRTIPSQHEQLERNGILESLELPKPRTQPAINHGFALPKKLRGIYQHLINYSPRIDELAAFTFATEVTFVARRPPGRARARKPGREPRRHLDHVQGHEDLTMAWGAKISATQLTAITTEQFFDQTPTLNPRESAHCHIEVDFPASPTDDAVISVYGSLDGTAWSAIPLMVLVLDKDVDPNSIDFIVIGSTSSSRGKALGLHQHADPAPISPSARMA